MNLLEQHETIEKGEGSQPITMLLQGMSGTGKSGATVALSIPEYVKDVGGRKLWVLNAEGPQKYAVLARSVLMGLREKGKITEAQMRAAMGNIEIADVYDEYGMVKIPGQATGSMIGLTKPATAWNRAMEILSEWVKKVGPHDVVVVDSFTRIAQRLCVASLQEAKRKRNMPLDYRDFNVVQDRCLQFLEYMAASFPCHTVVICHPGPYEISRRNPERKINKDDGSVEYGEDLVESGLAPLFVGNAKRLQVPMAYNDMLVTDIDSLTGKRRIYTKPRLTLATKTPFGSRARESYPIETGLVEYFALGDPNPVK